MPNVFQNQFCPNQFYLIITNSPCSWLVPLLLRCPQAPSSLCFSETEGGVQPRSPAGVDTLALRRMSIGVKSTVERLSSGCPTPDQPPTGISITDGQGQDEPCSLHTTVWLGVWCLAGGLNKLFTDLQKCPHMDSYTSQKLNEEK